MSKVKIQGNASGTGVLTVEAPNTNTDRTLTLPDSTGTLLNNGDAISLADSVKATFGTGNDLEIYHESSTNNSRIVESGTGNLNIEASNLNLKTPTGENYINCNENAAVDLRYDNVTKLSTTSTGVDINGHTNITDGYELKWGGSGATIYGSHSNNQLRLYTNNTERMRIDSGGRLLLNSTSYIYTTDVKLNVTSTGNYPAVFKRTDLDGSYRNMLGFQRNDGTIVGNIRCSSSATQYNTSSDYRLKEDVQPMSASIDRLKQLNPINFAWKETGDRVDGFLAHEAQAVVPEAVSGDKDAMRTEEYEVTPAVEATYDEEGNELTPAVEAVMGTREVEDYQGIDQSKLVPLLTSALQEAVAKIEALEARITTLEGGTV